MSEKRKRDEVVRELFTQQKIRLSDGNDISVSVCTLCGENGKPFKCETTYNLMRHLMVKHKKVAEERSICCAEEEEEEEVLPKGDQPGKPQKITLYMDKNMYITSIVQWVTECNLPKFFFSKKCVSRVLHPLESAMKLSSVSRKNVMRYVDVVESRMIAHISELVQGKLICIKADLASRKGRSVLSINGQIAIKGEIVVFTLAMVETHERNTAENIFGEIKKVLAKFKIDLCNVYSITTDNGSNFLKAARLMRDAQFLVLNDAELEGIPEEEKALENEDDGSDEFGTETCDLEDTIM